MAGKHVGNAAFTSALTHKSSYPGNRENRAFAEGYNGVPAAGNPHTATGNTVDEAAWDAGAAATSSYEVNRDPGLTTVTVSADVGGIETETAAGWSELSGTVGVIAGAVFFRFALSYPGVVIPQGSTITSATVRLDTNANNGTPSLSGDLQNTVTAAVPSASNYPTSWTLTGNPDVVAIQADSTNDIDVTAAMQVLVNNGSWNSAGERVNFSLEDAVGSGTNTAFVTIEAFLGNHELVVTY